MIESGFTAALRKKLIPQVYALKLNLSFAKGVPDCWYSGIDQDLWSEHKFLQELPPFVDPRKLLTDHQQQWLRGRFHEGRNVAVIIGWMHEDGRARGCVLYNLDWDDTFSREKVINMSLKIKDLAKELLCLLGTG